MLPAQNIWVPLGGGVWGVPENWSLNRVPAAGDDVVIPDLAGTQTITYSSGTSSINSLQSSENVTLSGGTLTVSTTVQVSGTFLLSGGGLASATVAAGTNVVGTSGGGTLTAVTVDGDLDLSRQQNAHVRVYGGLTLSGTALLGDTAGTTFGRLYFGDFSSPAGALTGGKVVFGGWSGANFIRNDSGQGGAAGTLTLGPG